MNPLGWKREHQVAFAIAILLGAGVGLLLGMRQHNSENWLQVELSWDDVSNFFANGGGWEWSLIGAAIAGTLVYVWQLLRT